MAFTYTDSLLTDADKVRFHIQDTVENDGSKPNRGNFSDNEIAGLITLEGSWQRATAAAYEALAAIWSQHPDQVDHTGLGGKKWQAAKRYAELAETWRKKHGYGNAESTLKSRPVTRTDAYSDDKNAVEYS